MSISLTDAIAALATPPGPAGRGVVRLTGDDVRAVAERVFVPLHPDEWRAARRPARHRGHVVLEGVCTPLPVEAWYWPGTRSYTGQPAIELHSIGSPPLLEALLAALFAAGARPARAGEFTLRAFLAGRIDLLQAEAVLGVIDAADDVQLSAALAQLAGGMSTHIAWLHETLLVDLADLEAGLDFVDEDIEFVERDQFRSRLAAAAATIDGLAAQADRRLQANARPVVALAGLPNAGKSTLFNALCGREAALVSAAPGTTRDWLRATVTWHDCPLELLDTAGTEAATDEISIAVQDAGQRRIAESDLVVWCTASDLSPAQQGVNVAQRDACARLTRQLLTISTKAELDPQRSERGTVAVSAHTDSGLGELKSAIVSRVDQRGQHVGELLGSTAARCRDSLRSARLAIGNAIGLLDAHAGDELIAVELRAALEQTGQIAGQVTTDDVLDRIFSRFCIGK